MQFKTFGKVSFLRLFSAIKNKKKPGVYVFILKKMPWIRNLDNWPEYLYKTNPGIVPSSLLMNFLKGPACKCVLSVHHQSPAL